MDLSDARAGKRINQIQQDLASSSAKEESAHTLNEQQSAESINAEQKSALLSNEPAAEHEKEEPEQVDTTKKCHDSFTDVLHLTAKTFICKEHIDFATYKPEPKEDDDQQLGESKPADHEEHEAAEDEYIPETATQLKIKKLLE